MTQIKLNEFILEMEVKLLETISSEDPNYSRFSLLNEMYHRVWMEVSFNVMNSLVHNIKLSVNNE